MNEQGNNSDFDLIIVGGGMVGASLACALGNSQLKIAVLEAAPFESNHQPSFDARTLALAYGSRRIFASVYGMRLLNAASPRFDVFTYRIGGMPVPVISIVTAKGLKRWAM